MIFDFVPKPVEISSCGVVPDNCVVGVGDPIAGDSYITLEHGERSDRTYHEVVLDYVVRLYPILNKNVVTFHPEAHVLLYCQVMGSVDGQHTSVGVVH